MPVLICMLRGVNVAGHHKIKMDDLRSLCLGLQLSGVQTHLQSGNVIFRTDEGDLTALACKIQASIGRKCGFRPEILLRTIPEMREVITRNPFARRKGIEPGKLATVFLEDQPSAAVRQALQQMDIAPEELHVIGRLLYIYFPNGQARPKISWSRVEKLVGPRYTGRNWNTVTKLLELAEALDATM
jgi:uncharacterized protein (DUF1697 family)